MQYTHVYTCRSAVKICQQQSYKCMHISIVHNVYYTCYVYKRSKCATNAIQQKANIQCKSAVIAANTTQHTKIYHIRTLRRATRYYMMEYNRISMRLHISLYLKSYTLYTHRCLICKCMRVFDSSRYFHPVIS